MKNKKTLYILIASIAFLFLLVFVYNEGKAMGNTLHIIL